MRHLNKLYSLILKIETDKKIELKNLNSIQEELEKISKILSKNKFNNKISLALNESISAIIKFKKNKKIQLDTKYLNRFWGIYTQNCCIIKIK